MLKKAGVVAAAAAGLMLMATPAAFAGEGHHSNGHDNQGGQVGLVNVGNVDVLHNVQVPICATGNDVAVGLVAVVADVLSPKGTADSCNAGIETGSTHN